MQVQVHTNRYNHMVQAAIRFYRHDGYRNESAPNLGIVKTYLLRSIIIIKS